MRLTGEEVFAAEHRSFSVLLHGEGIVSFPLQPQAHAVRVITENAPPDSCSSRTPRNRVRRPPLFFSPYSPDGTQDSAA